MLYGSAAIAIDGEELDGMVMITILISMNRSIDRFFLWIYCSVFVLFGVWCLVFGLSTSDR